MVSSVAEQDEQFVVKTVYGGKKSKRLTGEALHREREPLAVLDTIRTTLGEYNFAGQYQQAPAPLGGGLVKVAWFKEYTDAQKLEKFDQVLQSWDTANKSSELSDYSVCTTWGIKGKQIFLFQVFRKRVNYPDLKRAVREQAQVHRATVVLIEDRASGTQLIQELISDGFRVKAIKPEGDKVMRFNAQTAAIENGHVYNPREASWRAEYLHEITTFPASRYDDQVDSTSQALQWINTAAAAAPIISYYRQLSARKLHGEGLSFDEIAARLSSTPAEVEQWLANMDTDAGLLEKARQLTRPRCARCGGIFASGAVYTQFGGLDYHTECWRKMMFGK